MAFGVVMPEIGSPPIHTPKVNSSSIPTQNVGRLHSTSDDTTVVESDFLPTREPAKTPIITPPVTTMIVEQVSSRSVLTSARPTIALTSSCSEYE